MDAVELRSALRTVGHVLNAAEPTHPPGSEGYWQNVSARKHVVQAMVHIERYLCGAASAEDDLAHAGARLLLGLEVRERKTTLAAQLVANTEARRAR